MTDTQIFTDGDGTTYTIECPNQGEGHEFPCTECKRVNINPNIILGVNHAEYVIPTIIEPSVVQADMVNHPPHYTSHPSGVECIQITEHMNFNLGNALKYIWRADLKNGVQDLEKAEFYVKREIALRKKT